MSFVFHYRQALLYFVNRRHIIQTVTISLYRFDGVMRQIWAFAMMGLARQKLKNLNNLRFWKLLGSGTDQGFTRSPILAYMQFYACGIQLRKRLSLQIIQKYFQAINHNP